MPEAYIIDAVRTAVGKRSGGFAQSHRCAVGSKSSEAGGGVRPSGIQPHAVVLS